MKSPDFLVKARQGHPFSTLILSIIKRIQDNRIIEKIIVNYKNICREEIKSFLILELGFKGEFKIKNINVIITSHINVP